MSGRLRVLVDRDLCDAHGVCVEKAPAVFEIGEDDLMRVLVEHPPPEQIANVRVAVERCPKCALSLIEE